MQQTLPLTGWGSSMKKQYAKPVLARREVISAVTAQQLSRER
jgi:hypothetical protein